MDIENPEKREQQPDEIKPIVNWDDLADPTWIEPVDGAKWTPISIDLLKGIYSYGFEKPSEIQTKAIPTILARRDVIAQAQSGMGKTGAFSIGTLGIIDITKPKVQALLMAPTHELVKQTCNVIKALGTPLSGLRVKTLIGGTSIQEDAEDIRSSCPHVIVGTAGRIHDMFRRKYISGRDIKILVLDEADEMLSSGFKTQIYNIFQFMPESVQVALFSATLPPDILELTKLFMRNPVEIRMEAEKLNLECITQYYVALRHDGDKYDTLKDLFSSISVSQCIIYCNSIYRVTDLYRAMTDEGFSVCYIHSSMDKDERDKAFQNFRSGVFRVLISSDITARGIDIQQVSTVINFDITKCPHKYLHRIGRSGRWGRKGMAINFITKQDSDTMRRIERHYGIEIQELPASFNGNIC
jgi:translation initiation factor 4A